MGQKLGAWGGNNNHNFEALFLKDFWGVKIKKKCKNCHKFRWFYYISPGGLWLSNTNTDKWPCHHTWRLPLSGLVFMCPHVFCLVPQLVQQNSQSSAQNSQSMEEIVSCLCFNPLLCGCLPSCLFLGCYIPNSLISHLRTESRSLITHTDTHTNARTQAHSQMAVH